MNILFSWGTAIIMLLSIATPFIRKSIKKKGFRCLLWHGHKYIGTLGILCSLIHCSLTSRTSGQDSALGALLLLIQVLLALTYLLRRPLKKSWIVMHRVLTAVLILVMTSHIITQIL